jgi:iron complex outermembrane receptor protein
LNIKLESTALSLNEVEIADNYYETVKKANPMNIEIVSDDFLHHNTGGSLMQSLSRLPGISSIDIGSGQSKPLIRGLGFNRVLVTENGITHESQQWGSDHGLEIDQFAAGSIELIKGPASIIYGSDAIGGVINIKDSEIPEINSLNINADFIAKSNNDYLGTSVVVDGRKNKLFAGIRLTASDYGDYKVPTDSIDIYSYRAALHENRLRNTAGNEINFHINTGYFGEKMQLRLFVSSINSKSGFFANAHGLEPRSVDTLLHDASSRDLNYPYQLINHFKSSASIKWKLNRLSIESDIAYQRNFRQEFSKYESHGYMPAVFSDGNEFASDTEREFDKSVYSGNLKFTFLQSETTSFIAGVNSVYQNNKINGRSFIIPAYRQTTAGTYLLVSHSFSKTSRLQAGMRYDYGHIDTDEYQDWFTSPVMNNNDTSYEYLQRAQALSLSFGNTTWSIGYNYNPGKWNYKFNVGKSFRIPIPKELAANGVNYHHFSYEKGNASISPEISYQADAGILFGTKKFTAEVTPFVNYFPNYIYLNPTSDHDRLYGNGNQVFYYTTKRGLSLRRRTSCSLQINFVFASRHYRRICIFGTTLGEKEGFGLPFSPPAQMLITLNFMPKDRGIIQSQQ